MFNYSRRHLIYLKPYVSVYITTTVTRSVTWGFASGELFGVHHNCKINFVR